MFKTEKGLWLQKNPAGNVFSWKKIYEKIFQALITSVLRCNFLECVYNL